MQGKYRKPMQSEIDIAPVVCARFVEDEHQVAGRRWLTVACAALAGAAAGFVVFFG
jgi:hypothetical protein